MSGVITVDVSEFQRPVGDSYPHDWFSFRVCDGTYVDRNAAKNLAWAKKAAAAGKIAGYTCYCVYRPNTPTLQTVMRVIGVPDEHVTVMVDVESWGGAIHGNHSQAITALANGLGDWLGDRRRVLAYGNHGDLEALYPIRPPWLRFIVAGYGTQRPAFPNMIGWQYSDGDSRWPVPDGLPRKTKPFGNCDHNVFPGLTAAELAETLGVGGDMPLSDQDINKVAAAAASATVHALLTYKITDPDNPKSSFPLVSVWWWANRFAKDASKAPGQPVVIDAEAVADDIHKRLIADLGGQK